MKDLAFCIEFVEYHSFSLSTPGLRMLELYAPLLYAPGIQITPISFSLVKTITYHNLSRSTLDFWHIVVRLMGQYIGKEIQVLLVSLGPHFFSALVELFSWATNVNTPVNTKCSAIESTRDPPTVFIPIPRIESTNGCARSDLSARLFLASEFQCKL